MPSIITFFSHWNFLSTFALSLFMMCTLTSFLLLYVILGFLLRMLNGGFCYAAPVSRRLSMPEMFYGDYMIVYFLVSFSTDAASCSRPSACVFWNWVNFCCFLAVFSKTELCKAKGPSCVLTTSLAVAAGGKLLQTLPPHVFLLVTCL